MSIVTAVAVAVAGLTISVPTAAQAADCGAPCMGVPATAAGAAAQLIADNTANKFIVEHDEADIIPKEIQRIADGSISQNPECGIDTRTLQMLVIIIRQYGQVQISDLSRRCANDGKATCLSNPSSYHCVPYGNVNAVDITYVGRARTRGNDAASSGLLTFLDTFLPAGSRAGQIANGEGAGHVPCGNYTMPSLGNISRFADDCTHQHVDLGNSTGPLRNITTTAPATPSTDAVFSAVVNPNGNQNVFWRDKSNGHLKRVWKTATGQWSGVIDHGFAIGGAPTAISTGGGGIDVFFAGTDGHLRHSYYTGATWVDDVAIPHIGGSIKGTISAISKSGGAENVFWRDSDDKLQQSYFASGGWFPSSSLASGLTGSPTALLASSSTDVFFRGAGNAAFHVWYGTSWSGVQSLPTGDVAGAITATMGGNIENVFWRGSNGTLNHIYAGPATGGWKANGSLASGLTGDPTAITTQSGMDVFFAASSSSLNHVWYGNTWSPALGIPYTSAVNSAIAATTNGAGTENVFWMGDGKLSQSYVLPGGQWLPSPPITP
ncbi:hypothetical protein [Leifsonia aquatica]|uniref:hypothetical protein n=1 Tax=Leifsonia aquatica TaxID=144185 RepID=UPI001965FF1B|nr:hypothetical protein [Leifsonia aquatica]